MLDHHFKQALAMGSLSDTEYFWGEDSFPSLGIYQPLTPAFVDALVQYRAVVADGRWPICCCAQVRLSLFNSLNHINNPNKPSRSWSNCLWLCCSICGSQTSHFESLEGALSSWRAGRVFLYGSAMRLSGGQYWVEGVYHDPNMDNGETGEF